MYLFSYDPEHLTLNSTKYISVSNYLNTNREVVEIENGIDVLKVNSEKNRSHVPLSYHLRQIIHGKDGKFIFLFEEYAKYISTQMSGMTAGSFSANSTTHFEYNDIVAIQINSEKEIDWMTSIPKFQHTSESGGIGMEYKRTSNAAGYTSSFWCFQQDEKIYMIFNDNLKNTLPNSSGKTYASFGNNQTLSMVMVDSLGNTQRESIFPLSETVLTIVPKESNRINSRKVVLYGMYGSKQRYFSFDIK